jgi:hypothetical protein
MSRLLWFAILITPMPDEQVSDATKPADKMSASPLSGDPQTRAALQRALGLALIALLILLFVFLRRRWSGQ